VTAVCRWCGSEFSVERLTGPVPRYCSDACRFAYSDGLKYGRWTGGKARCRECGEPVGKWEKYCEAHRLEDAECPICHESFKRKRSKKPKRTCGKAECIRAIEVAARRAQLVRTGLVPKVDRTCEWCGKSFTAPRHKVAKGYGRFCCEAHATYYGNWSQHGPVSMEIVWRNGRASLLDRRKMYEAQARRLGSCTAKEKRDKRAQYSGMCAYGCGRRATTWDHIIPVSDGGSHTIDNQVPCCRHCNSSKGAKPLGEWHPTVARGKRQGQMALGLV
jgi:hypothetical protein